MEKSNERFQRRLRAYLQELRERLIITGRTLCLPELLRFLSGR